ncbi:Fc receptor-like protein 6 isoform X10 [Piliocolobus tephrosceles]|nr:Fc receptor-like protein 6 isoform X10 [Piliocolobus tephrosceles]XP_023069967.2 Fc receptor-like protein 6 isoform X10 [Piliocolobus tephrosceles]XP_026312817.1 Fc receptor-like protein 6 isoform X10 [Piliocolobus tephrosceles]
MEAATVQSSGQYSCTGQVMYIPQIFTLTSETVMVQVQELFPPPVLSASPSPEPREGSLVTLRCQTKLHPLRSTLRLLFSFHKDSHTLQDRGPHPELCIPGVKEGDSGLYWCEVALKGGQVQKQSPQLGVRVQAPVSCPVLTLHHGPTDPAVGDMVQLLCEAQRGSPPILYLFYLDEKIVGNHSAPCGGNASLLFPVKSEQDAGNYSCEAENGVSRERSEPKKLSLKGSQVLSIPTSSNWLVPWLPVSLLGMMVIAAALLVYLRPWRKAGPLPSQIPPPAPGGEQCPLYANVQHQKEKDEGIVYSVVHRTSKRSEARPAEFAAERKDSPIIYAEVRCLQPSEVSSKEVNIRSTLQESLGDCEEVLC